MRAENGVVLRRTYSPIVGLYPSLSQFYWTAGLAKPPPRRAQLAEDTHPSQALAKVVAAVVGVCTLLSSARVAVQPHVCVLIGLMMLRVLYNMRPV